MVALAALTLVHSCGARHARRGNRQSRNASHYAPLRNSFAKADSVAPAQNFERLNSPFDNLPNHVTVSIVATLPVSRSNGCMDIARQYADTIVYSGLRDAARSISIVLAVESADDALLLDKVANYLRSRLLTASIVVDAYATLSNAGAQQAWMESKTLGEPEARRNVLLFTGFSTDNATLATQKEAGTHVASTVIWSWKDVVRAFNEHADVFRAGYDCDRKGLLFHSFWVRSAYVHTLPGPRDSTISNLPVTETDYMSLWLEHGLAPVGHDPAAVLSWQNAHTISICNNDANALRPGMCHDGDHPSKHPSSAFIACACRVDASLSQPVKPELDGVSMKEAVALCSSPDAR